MAGAGGRIAAGLSSSGLSAPGGISVSFVEQHGLWTPEHKKAAEAVERDVAGRGLGVVRFSFADQHGILRGKTVVAEELPGAMRAGVEEEGALGAPWTERSVPLVGSGYDGPRAGGASSG